MHLYPSVLSLFIFLDPTIAASLPTSLPADLSVLLLWGTKDRSTPPQAVAASSKFVPRLQDVALEGGGHWLMLEKPEIVTQVYLFVHTTDTKQNDAAPST